MKTPAFIIAKIGNKNVPIAKIITDLQSGETIEYSYQRVSESVDARREYNLVNASSAKISRAKKYARGMTLDSATPVAEFSFFISEI
jgi:hypothetical protein